MDKLLLSPEYVLQSSDIFKTEVVEEFPTNSEYINVATPPVAEALPIKEEAVEVPSPKLEPLEDYGDESECLRSEFEILRNPIPNLSQLLPPAAVIAPPSSDIFLQLQNVVARANLRCRLDLRRIAMHAKNAEFNPKRLPVLYMRIRRPYAVARIFGNGRLICTGAKSVQSSHAAARRFARIIQKLGFPVRFGDYKIENIIASCELKFHVRLELFEHFWPLHCVYEPELFPGLICRLVRPHVQILIFSSGRMILSGVKQCHELQQALWEIYPVLRRFEKRSLGTIGLI